jgi:hypothetical protein
VQGANHPLHARLVLFHEMVEILALTAGNRRTRRLVGAPDRRGLGFTASNGERFWHAMAAARFGEQALGSRLSTRIGAQDINGLAIAQIERQFGKGTIMHLGAQPTALDIAVIPTGAISIDAALGVGGIPRGRVTEIFGPEASGKTTLALHLIAQVQQAGGIAAFIDAEHALDPVYAQKLGVKTDELLIAQPDTGEQALEIAETLVRSGAIDVIVVDSVAVLVPKAELNGEMGDAPMGMQARLMSQALRKLTAIISKSRTAMIFSTSCARRSACSWATRKRPPAAMCSNSMPPCAWMCGASARSKTATRRPAAGCG